MTNAANEPVDLIRYQRQMLFAPLGADGQRALTGSRVVIVGLGGLGSWAAELLVRAGVGFLRLIDDDKVELTNIHRQALYDEQDARAGKTKVNAAASHLQRINSAVTVEPVAARMDCTNAVSLTKDATVILDGTDNFATRFLINDVAVKFNHPWVFAGVVGAEAQTMTIVPNRTACLRCVLEVPPPPCSDPSCNRVGVLGPAVAAIAAFQVAETMKILAGKLDEVRPYLLKFDVWTNTLQRIDATDSARSAECPCCGHKEFEFLEP
ncbi:MAG: HesA/MoeB/ThiF family protein [Planctomycetota bacterium]|jgi:adenylyltransferase/sulfurtransferase